MAFHLDTTGIVLVRAEGLKDGHPHAGSNVVWPDLSPFTQGYVEAMIDEAATIVPEGYLPDPAFRDLAPEALAQIIADCEAMVSKGLADTQEQGRAAWEVRQAGITVFPPLTVQLGDDGKVRFSAGEQAF